MLICIYNYIAIIHDKIIYNIFNYYTTFSLVIFEPLADSPPKYPNIGYLGSSYDILKGNPQNTDGLDPGFLGRGIFQFTYNQGLTTADGRYSIPDYTTVNDAQSCSFSFSSRINKDTASYMDSLKIHVDASFKGWGASFSASSDYQEIHQSTQSRQTVFISSQSQCEAYDASIDYSPFTHDFHIAVNSLSEVINSSTKQDYLTFIEQYGTHIASAVKMGGRFGVRSEFSTTNYSNLCSSGVNVKASAGYSGVIDISSSLATEDQEKAAKAFNDQRRSYKLYQVGGDPPVDENGTTFEWAQTVKNDPLPLSYSMIEVYKYFTSQYFPNIANIDKKNENLRNVISDYCMIHALDRSLCLKDFGPDKIDAIRAINSNQYTKHTESDLLNYWYWTHYQTDPNLRVLGTYIGAVNHTITGNTILVDSRKAPSNVITSPIGSINLGENIFRYQCPDGYSTLSDNFNGKIVQADTHMCVADQCLTGCTRVETSDTNIFLIGDGFPELGNSGSLEYGSFFRNLSITDDTLVDEFFKCLTYECLSFY